MMKNDDNKNEPGQAEDSSDIKRSDYLRIVRTHLRNKEQKEAFKVLQQAAVQFAEDPLIMSYFGCLLAVVDKKYRSGVEACKQAISLLQARDLFEEEALYPVFYLNLARAYRAAGKKSDAIAALHDGLTYEPGSAELKKELREIGVRKSPAVPFLDRSNPINKYIGMLLHKPKASLQAGKSRNVKKS